MKTYYAFIGNMTMEIYDGEEERISIKYKKQYILQIDKFYDILYALDNISGVDHSGELDLDFNSQLIIKGVDII